MILGLSNARFAFCPLGIIEALESFSPRFRAFGQGCRWRYTTPSTLASPLSRRVTARFHDDGETRAKGLGVLYGMIEKNVRVAFGKMV